MEDLKIVTKVDYSDWATPIVVVQKPNGKVRICGDYRATVNPCLHIQQHPIPRIEELFAKLQGGVQFSKLDMRDPYLQIELDDETKQLLVINTHKGLYRYNRLYVSVRPLLQPFSRNWWTIWLPAFQVSQLTWTTSSSLGRQRWNTSKTCDAFSRLSTTTV